MAFAQGFSGGSEASDADERGLGGIRLVRIGLVETGLVRIGEER
jgi:hypothetical protein